MYIQKDKDIEMMETEIKVYMEKYGGINREDIEKLVRDHHDFDSERYQLSEMLNNLENLIHDDSGVHDATNIGEQKKENLQIEMSLIKDRMSVMEHIRKHVSVHSVKIF
ncbi:hypothetical protein LXL04_023328 [Taraxacum kok-saghyz]